MTNMPNTTVSQATRAPVVSRPRAIGRLGTGARVLVGVALLAGGMVAGGGWISWWQLALGIVGMPIVLIAAQATRLAFTKRTLRQTSHLATCLNCTAVAGLLTLSQTRDATLVFLGGSMLLAADRGYGGCVTLAIGNWLLRRNDQVGCLLFGPLDAFAGAARASVSVSAALGPIHRVPSRRLPLDTNAGATPAYAPYLVLRQSQVPCRRSARDNRGQSSNPRASRGLRSSRRKCLCRTKAGHQA